MRWDLQNDSNLGYREKSIEQFDKIQAILAEEANMIKSEEDEMKENINLRLESTAGLFASNRDDSKFLLAQEYQIKKYDVAKTIFTECVKSSLPLNEALLESREAYIEDKASELFDAMVNTGLLEESVEGGAWERILSGICSISADSSLSLQECIVESVNQYKNIIDGLITRVEGKLERVVKLEKETTTFQESHQFMNNPKTMFRYLIESNYKELSKEELPSDITISEEALVRATIDYAMLETINTSKMIGELDYDHVMQNFRVLR